MTKEFLTSVELAEFLGVGRHMPAHWRSAGEGPPCCKFGKTVRYPVNEVREWAQRQLQSSKRNDQGTLTELLAGGA